MKFMVQWCVHEGSRHEALKAFSQTTLKDELGAGADKMKFIGRWHDIVGLTGVAIIETNDINAINGWLLKWNAIVDITVTPVLDDEETKQAAKDAGIT